MVQKLPFGSLENGRSVEKWFISHSSGCQLAILSYGAIMQSLLVPDRNGELRDIILGYDHIRSYEQDMGYLGAFIGRFANRIDRGNIVLNDATYRLTCNERGINHLHGGTQGFHKQLWDVRERSESGLRLYYLSREGEEGYPGTLSVNIDIYWSGDDQHPKLHVDMKAETDKDTIVNLTYHPYFHLAGDFKQDILEDELVIYGNQITALNEQQIPTGKLIAVENTPFDFRTPVPIGTLIHESYLKVKQAGGYDQNFVLNQFSHSISTVQRAASLWNPKNGIELHIGTTQPGLQFFTAGFLDESYIGKNDQPYFSNCALCLEPQHFPDSPNHPHFPSTIVGPETPYHHQMEFTFGAR